MRPAARTRRTFSCAECPRGYARTAKQPGRALRGAPVVSRAAPLQSAGAPLLAWSSSSEAVHARPVLRPSRIVWQWDDRSLDRTSSSPCLQRCISNGDMDSNRLSHHDTDAAAHTDAAPSSRPALGQRVDDLAGRATREQSVFHRFAQAVRGMAGSPRTTALLACGLAAWVGIGPLVHFSRGWELTATAGAPIVALILLLLIQHTQNRDDRATQLKLNELIRADNGASDRMIGIEDSAAPDLVRLQDEYRRHVATRHHPSRNRRRFRLPRRSPWRPRRHHASRRPWKVVWLVGGTGDRDGYEIVCSRHASEMSARREARRLARSAERTLSQAERTWHCSVERADDPASPG